MWKTCIIWQSVGVSSSCPTHGTDWPQAKKEASPEQALKEFRAIVDQEEEKGDWCVTLSSLPPLTLKQTAFTRGFKALKQSTKILFLQLRRPSDALETYKELLTYTKSAVTRNYSEKTINGILDYVGGGKGGQVEVNVLEKFYQATKKALEDAKNEVCARSARVVCDRSLRCRGYRRRPTSSSQNSGLTRESTLGSARFVPCIG